MTGRCVRGDRRSDGAWNASRSPTSPSSSATSTWKTSPAARSRCAGTSGGSRRGPGRRRRRSTSSRAATGPRVSTCFLIDDYFTRFSSPDVVIPQLVAAAEESGLVIDYVARESGCVGRRRHPAGPLVEQQLVADPVPGTTGVRPPPTETGWLCNGQRSPNALAIPAMADKQWLPPVQNAANRHSIFVDVELWDYENGRAALVLPLPRVGLAAHPARPAAPQRRGGDQRLAGRGAARRLGPAAGRGQAQPAGDGVQRLPHVLGAAGRASCRSSSRSAPS